MKLTRSLSFVLGVTTLFSSSIALAQTSNHYLGRAVSGQSVNLDLNSINRVSANSVDFVYFLGDERRYSQANCAAGTWTTFSDGVARRPQSETTSEMLRIVCSGGSVQPTQNLGVQPLTWVVSAPPSNVRTSPNGAVQCVVRTERSINVIGWDGDWAITNVCGSRGYIHESQLEAFD